MLNLRIHQSFSEENLIRSSVEANSISIFFSKVYAQRTNATVCSIQNRCVQHYSR